MTLVYFVQDSNTRSQMSNNWFQFKQFKILQGKTAMKVGTDGVLLGSWVDVGGEKDEIVRILDVGTGTGLVALMIAQRSTAEITAIEIDEAAAAQADENFKNSPWADRISSIHADYRSVKEFDLKKFDHVVCNPPFFSSGWSSLDKKRSLARHDNELSLASFIEHCLDVLTSEGRVSLILPSDRFDEAQDLFKQRGFSLVRKLGVSSRENGKVIRVVSEWRLKEVKPFYSEISIYCEHLNEYTNEYRDLTKEYYLNQ